MCDFRDPATVGARIFIGNIAENTTRENVKEYFGKYGEIVGILLQRQFAFVQFATDDAARESIKGCHYSMFMDRKITVRSATNNPGERKKNPYLGGQGNSNNGGNVRDRSPHDDKGK
jgi:RNA recognition motif-containing protein